MSTEAFNNYCLACDKICSDQSIYCSDVCKEKDEQHSSALLQPGTDIVSPLLTPSLYQSVSGSEDAVSSPFLLPRSARDEDDVKDFSLNYSLSMPMAPSSKAFSSASQNYKLWLTGVM